LKGRRTIFIVLVALGLSASAIGSESDSFVVEFQFSIVQSEGCSTLMVEDTMLQEIPGEPLIPYYSARILLPQDTEVKEVKVKHTDPIVEKGIDMVWGQLPCTSSDVPVKVGRNEEIYGSDKEYPNELYRIVSTESFRGFRILNLILYPVQYQSKSQTVKFYSELYVHVQVKEGVRNELYRGLKCDKEAVKSMVNNPEMADMYGDNGDILPFSETYEYIIITNDTLQSTFQDLADWKSLYVNGTNIYTVSSIYSEYYQEGRDNQERIREFIEDMYTDHGTRYVLLGGDVSVIPYRGFYVSCIGYTDIDIAADMYYAHLDGTFNADNDSYWAETTDGVDWYAEVAVGRAPVETISEAENFVNKVIAYELAYKPKVCQFHQARVTLTCENNPDSRCLAWNCDNWVPLDYARKYLFEEDQTVTKDLWRSAWDGSFDGEPHTPPLVIQHMGDNPMYYPDCDPTCYEINCSPQITWCCSDVPTLTNTFWPWHTSAAPFTGKFIHDDCLAECYVNDDCGAIACFMNSSYSWCSSSNACRYSGEFIEKQFRALFSDGKEKFGDLLNQSKSYMVSSAASDCVYRWCFYEINLIGDPESPCLTKRSGIKVTNPSDGSEVSGTVNITVDAWETVTAVEFWIDKNKNSIVDGEDLYCYDTEEPFQCVWDTTNYPEGEEFTIYLYSYCSSAYQGYETVTVTVNNFHIISPAERSKACIGNSVAITASTAASIDTVKFYLIWTANDNINGVLLCTDTGAPFACNWNTTGYVSRWYTIRVEAYSSGELKNVDQILIKLMAC
jgi:hypothetical protein